MHWPLSHINRNIPDAEHPGGFGAVRKFDIHTGVDLYCDPWDDVHAMEDGTVVGIIDFTGEAAGSPWWNNTQAVMVESADRVILYGELVPIPGLTIGQKVWTGQVIGSVKTVLKKDKGLPMTMLHLEFYKCGTREPAEWMHEHHMPETLLDPTPCLRDIKRRFNARQLEIYREITPVQKKHCAYCDGIFETKFRKYCSTSCRMKAFRKKKLLNS